MLRKGMLRAVHSVRHGACNTGYVAWGMRHGACEAYDTQCGDAGTHARLYMAVLEGWSKLGQIFTKLSNGRVAEVGKKLAEAQAKADAHEKEVMLHRTIHHMFR